jgi:CHRD domain
MSFLRGMKLSRLLVALLIFRFTTGGQHAFQIDFYGALTAAAFLLLGTQGRADDGNNMFSARFSGFQEIGALATPTGAIFSQGQGTLVLNIDRTNRLINFTLMYSNLSSNVLQSHIHFGKEHVAGAVMVFFCSNLAPPSPPTPTPQDLPVDRWNGDRDDCRHQRDRDPQTELMAGDFDALLAAIQSNTAYGNIHTVNFPSGEIRGQILQNDD